MAQVSRWPLKKEVWEKIFDLFLHSLVKLNRKNELSLFIHDLLSPTERVMLAKRLAIALLLSKGHSYPVIRGKLHVTSSTIAKVNRQLQEGKGGLGIALNKIFALQNKEMLGEELKDLLDQKPPGYYRSEWGRRKRKRRLKIKEIKDSF
jgi:uncharacterized protein YerC